MVMYTYMEKTKESQEKNWNQSDGKQKLADTK